MRSPPIAALLVLAASCGNRHAELPAGTRAYLEAQAGVLAPALTLPESIAGPPPDSAALEELLGLCDADPSLYVYFYACLVESVNTLEAPEQTLPGGAADTSVTSPAGRGVTGPSTL